jgi:hypothetical protein
MSDAVRFYAKDYAAARAAFLAAAHGAGLAVASHAHALAGPDGEDLACDAVWIGPADAARVLVVISATHGIEGFAGSAAQIGWLEEGRYAAAAPGVAQLLIHAINPHGFAHQRRVTEGNVDLNRNFADFDRPLPDNPAYEALHAALCPRDWDRAAKRHADRMLAAYEKEHGAREYYRAVNGGQYVHEDGLFYGGAAPTWSRRTLLGLLDTFCARARDVAVVDIHTGLGPYGEGESFVVGAEGSPALARGKAWFSAPMRTIDASKVHRGYNLLGIAAAMPQAAVTAVTLEFGTFAMHDMIDALRADNWLYLHGDPESAAGLGIKANIRRMFYPEEPLWQRMVYARSVGVMDEALKGLGSL